MAYITFEDYQALHYNAVPEAQFDRYNARAEQTVRRYTQQRIATMQPPDDATDDDVRIMKMNRRGMCELIDLYFLGDNPNSDAAKDKVPVVSFKNQNYSETRLGSDRGDQKAATPNQMTVADVMNLFFAPSQTWRGVG